MATTTANTAGGIVSPPHPSSTLVNISDEADIKLVNLLSPSTNNPSKFEKSCMASIENGNYAKLLTTFISHGAIGGLLKETYTLNEAVSVVSLLTVYLDRCTDSSISTELCGALADTIAKGISSGGGDVNSSKMKEKQSAMIAALFNLRSNANEKVKLLTKIIDLSDTSTLVPGEPRGVSALADMLCPATLSSTLKLWGDSDNVELRALYGSISNGMGRVLEKLAKDEQEDKTTVRKIKVAKEWKQNYMLAFLETYKEEVRTKIE